MLGRGWGLWLGVAKRVYVLICKGVLSRVVPIELTTQSLLWIDSHRHGHQRSMKLL